MCSKWTEDTTVKFVELYKNEECLWNTNIVKYRNKKAREAAIKRIGDAMDIDDFDPADIKTKIKNLRSTYVQEIAKIKKSQCSGAEADEIYKPKLKWFSIMHSFLHNFDKRRETYSTLASQLCEVGEELEQLIPKAEILQDESEEVSYQEELVAEEELKKYVNHTVNEPIPKRYKIEKTNVKEIGTCIRDSLTTSIQSMESSENEFDIFGKSVAVQLKKLPLSLAIRAQDQIQQLLTRFRLESIENTSHISYGFSSS